MKKKTLTERVEAFLIKNKGQKFTYMEVAKRLKSHPIAVGQALKSLGAKKGKKRLTNQVISSKQAA